MGRGTVIGIVIAGVLVAGVGGAVAVSLADRETDAATPSRSAQAGGEPTEVDDPDPQPTTESSEPTAETTEPARPGEYVEYSDSALAAAAGTPVLFFHAPWCPQCRALEADILATGVPDGVTILKVDYDSNQALRQRFGVTIQTTVVALDPSGDPAAVFVAYDEPTLGSALAGLGLGG